MKASLVAGVLLFSAFVIGCATGKATPPPAQALQLGSYKAQYRVYGPGKDADLCRQEPRRVRDELDQLNGMLADFLGATSAGYDGVWADEQVALLADAPKVLPPALDALDGAVAKVPSCDFDAAVDFTETLARGREFSAQARKRVAEAAPLHAYLTARRALDEWRNTLPQTQESAKQAFCQGRKSQDIYHASQDETGKRTWLFCDGVTVEAAAGGAPALVPALPKKKAARAKAYLGAVARHPEDQLSRAPKPPERPKQAEAQEEEPVDLDQPIDP